MAGTVEWYNPETGQIEELDDPDYSPSPWEQQHPGASVWDNGQGWTEDGHSTWSDGTPWAPTLTGRPTEEAYYQPPPTGATSPLVGPSPRPPTSTPTPKPTPTPPPSGGGGGGSTGPSFDLGPLLQPYPGQFTKPTFGVAAKQLMDLVGPTPEFNAPALPTIAPFSYENYAEPEAFSYQDYTPTTSQDVFSDPSFGLRKDIGEKALLNSKAAQGLARTGGTLKDLLDYNQNFASQEYSNVDNRRTKDYGVNRGNALENYNTNVGNKVTAYGLNRQNAADSWKANKDTSLGLYDRGFEAKRAEFEPQLYGWSKKGDLATRAEEKAYDNSYNEFMGDFNIWRTGQNDIFDKLKWSSEFGLDAATR